MDVNIVLAGLRNQWEHCERMQYLCPDQYDFYKEEYNKVERIYKLFKDVQDRVFRSDNLSARINIKLN